MRRFIPQSVAARIIFALVLCFSVLFTTLVAVHDVLLRHAVDWSTEELLAQRLATVLDTMAAAPDPARDGIAQALSKQGLRVHRGQHILPASANVADDAVNRIEQRTRTLLRLPMELRFQSGTYDKRSNHLTGVDASARLEDGSWVDVEVMTADLLSAELWWLYVQAFALGLVLLLAVGFAAQAIANPITALATAVSRLDPAQNGSRLPTSGPREVRQLAEAINDMTERTQNAFRQRTLALSALSHDLVTPIARLRLRSEDLPLEQSIPIQRDLSEMETMVLDVLAYLRGGHGGELPRPVAVAALVRTVADEFGDGGQLVELRQLDDRVVVMARPVALKRAVINLLTNAFRHGRDPWMEVRVVGEKATVCVGDRGPGIPAEDLPYVTEPFFRGDRARTVGGGSGLGLATVRAIAEVHKGDFYIRSIQPGGTLATLVFPLHNSESSSASAQT